MPEKPSTRGAGLALKHLFLLLILSFPATATAGVEDLQVENAWLRIVLPSRPAAGYFDLVNNGDDDMVLVAAKSEACGAIMLHRTKADANLRKTMEMLNEVTVPAHGVLGFAPAGYHLMCMNPTDAVKAGEVVRITLEFQDGSEIAGDFLVKQPKGMP